MSNLENYEEEKDAIRKALLIGLDCFGEIERLINTVEVAELTGSEVPKELCPKHPTGAADTVSDFAYALRALESIG